MKCLPALALLGASAAAACASSASAQTPSPTPAPTPAAFSAQAHADVTVVTQNATISGTALLAVAQRANLLRIDILSLKSDAFPLPPFTATLVIDRNANTITVWSDATKKYRVQSFFPRARPTAAPRTSPKPTPPAVVRVGRSPFADLDVLELSVKLTGHTTTAGLPTTGLAFDLQVRKHGDAAASHVTAATQIADEFAAFPVSIDAAIEPGAAGFSAKAAYAVDQFARDLPPAARFVVPRGYAQANSLFEAVLPQHGTVWVRPGPSAVPTASPSPR